MNRIPLGCDYLFPALTTIFWIEKDREQPRISSRTSRIEMPAFQAIRPAALRFLAFELHDFSAPLGLVLTDKKFFDRVMEFIALLRHDFPNFYTSNICVCCPHFCAHPYIRHSLNKIHAAIMSAFPPLFSYIFH